MIRIRNWERFQNYKNRRPPWIKLHRGLLDSDQFCDPEFQPWAWLLIALWLIASGTENGTITMSVSGIARVTGSDVDKVATGLLVLERFQFITTKDNVRPVASTLQADGSGMRTSDCPEERRGELQSSEESRDQSSVSTKLAQAPFIEMWRTLMPRLRALGFPGDTTDASILKALHARGVLASEVEDVAEGLVLLVNARKVSLDENGLSMRLLYSHDMKGPVPLWTQAHIAYMQYCRELVGGPLTVNPRAG